MDLRNPPRDWRRNPPSIAAVLAFLALLLFAGGVLVSRSASVSATPMGTLIDATRRVRDSTDALPDIFFTGATIIAGIFVASYVFGIINREP